MATRRLKRALLVLLVAGSASLGIAALLLLGRDAPSLTDFGRRHVLILGITAVATTLILLLLLVSVARLARDYLRRIPGARLRARLVVTFTLLTVVPLAVVYFFAVQFLNAGIDSWFDRDLEHEISTALRLSRETMDVQSRSRLRQTTALARTLGGLEGTALARALGVLRADGGAEELAIFAQDLTLIAMSGLGDRLPTRPPEDAVLSLKESGRFVALEPEGANGYQIRALVTLPERSPGEIRYLQAIWPIGSRQGSLVDAVQDTYMRFSELRYLREPLKESLALTLFLVLLLSLLAASGGALFFARRLVAPLESLVAGTEAVAKGDLDTRLPDAGSDEVGFLIRSFNGMINRLRSAREDSRRSQQQLERERGNLAAILARLSTGVVAVSRDGDIRIANDASGSILGVDLAGRVGEPVREVAAGAPLLGQLLRAWAPHMTEPAAEWRGQIELRTESSRRILNCASSPVPGDGALEGGSILVFDDVTELLQAQREAAWGEVARRLAHEIKNPLTPIRLAAERIRRRYLPAMTADDRQVLERSTHTIVQQVEAMRDMVNAFSDYARAPALTLKRMDLNTLIHEVAWLYRDQRGQPAVTLDLDEAVQEVEADPVRMRQLLHNLIRNAQEALEGRDGGMIVTRTRRVERGDRTFVEIVVSDNGPGIDPEALPAIFEPYVTTKKKGTGLGLAIVRKLVEEHGGQVSAENVAGGGARITVRLPANRAGREDRVGARSARPEARKEQA